MFRPPDHPFTGKPVAILGCSPGISGTMRAQYHLRQVMVFLDIRPLNKPEVFVADASNLFEDGKLTDDDTAVRLGNLIAVLAAWFAQISK